MEYREDLKAYVDGELPAAKAESIQRAAESDPALQREIDDLRTVGQALQAMKTEPVPQGLEQTLMALSGYRSGPARVQNRRPRWLGFSIGLGLAAVAALIVAIPQMTAQRGSPARASLVAMSFRDKTSGRASREFTRTRETMAPQSVTSAGVAAPKAAPTLQDQVKQEQSQIDTLQKQILALKAKAATIPDLGPDKLPRTSLPAPPAMNGTIVPAQVDGLMVDANVGRQKGLSPKQVGALEGQVRKAAVAAGGKVEVSGPAVMRSVVVTIDTAKSATLVSKVRLLLKDGGTVTTEDVPRTPDDGRTQTALDRIDQLKLVREKLLQDFLPEAPQVKEIDAQLKTLQDSIKPNQEPPKTRIHVAIG